MHQRPQPLQLWAASINVCCCLLLLQCSLEGAPAACHILYDLPCEVRLQCLFHAGTLTHMRYTTAALHTDEIVRHTAIRAHACSQRAIGIIVGHLHDGQIEQQG